MNEFGVDVNATNNYGGTTLHIAAKPGRTETVRVLVNEFGANVAIVNRDGDTAGE